MGRSDAVAFVLECVREWRALGATVTFEDGWDRRGNGTAADYVGGLVHHTASPSSPARPFPTRSMLITGRPNLRGPLSNVGGPWCPPDAPALHVIAAHPANHAGASGGRSMGPLPVTRLFNKQVLGLEVDYAGTVPMAPGQYAAMRIFTAGVTRVLGRRSPEWVRGHAETSITGKWDPGYAPDKTIDLTALRAQAWQAATTTQEDSMPNAAELLDAPIKREGPGASGVTTVRAVAAWSDSNLRQVRLDVVADVAKLLAPIERKLDELLARPSADVYLEADAVREQIYAALGGGLQITGVATPIAGTNVPAATE